MSEKELVQITIGISPSLQKTIELHAENTNKSENDVILDFLYEGAINKSVQAIIRTEVESCAKAINCQIVELSGKIDKHQLQIEGHLDSLEISVDKVIERFN